jgi:hypothetical protein
MSNPSTEGKPHAQELPTLYIHSEMTKTPPTSRKAKPSLFKSLPLSLILESDVPVPKASSVKIHTWPNEQELQTLEACPICPDMPRLTYHSNAVDAHLKNIVDMELPNSIDIMITELQTSGDNIEFTMSASTDNKVWGSEVTLMNHE